MKKGFMILFLFTILLGLTACSSEKVDDELTNKVIQLEKSEYQFLTREISYDDFKDKIADIVAEPNYYDEIVVLSYTSNGEQKTYKAKHFNGLSLKETNTIFEQAMKEDENLKNSLNGITAHFKLAETNVSKSYDYESQGWRYVYSLTEYITSETEQYYTSKRYQFIEQDGEWKITHTDADSIWFNESTIDQKDEILPKLRYQTHNNEPVDYITEFKPLEKD